MSQQPLFPGETPHNTAWALRCGDILDTPADALVCSANVQLNMSGGVGGAILLKCGNEMQRELKAFLEENHLTTVPPGTIVETPPCGTRFQFVLHAVAVDAFYETSADLIESTLRQALRRCAEKKAKTVALTALGTGFGRFPLSDFALILRKLSRESFAPIKTVILVLQNPQDVQEIANS